MSDLAEFYKDIDRGHDAFLRSEAPPASEPPRWPEPDLSPLTSLQTPAPAFPLDLFGRGASIWIASAAESKGAPIDFVAVVLLAVVGVLIANHRRGSPWPGWVAPPLLYVANVGNPSSNKSPALESVVDELRRLEEELNGDHSARVEEHARVKATADAATKRWLDEVKKAEKDGYPAPERPEHARPPAAPTLYRLFTNDTTTERLVRLSAENDRGLLVVRDELAGWIGSMDKYGNGNGSDRALYLEAYEGRRYAQDRVKDEGNPICTPALSVAIVGGIQPDRLSSLLFKGDDDGLTARLIYVWPEKAFPTRPRKAPPNESIRAALRRLATLDRDSDGRARVVPFEDDAADLLQKVREEQPELEEQVSGMLRSWVGKIPGFVVRLALIFEYLWWAFDRSGEPPPSTISARACRTAVAFVEGYAFPMAKRTFGDAALPQVERDAQALARWIMAQPTSDDTLNERAIRRKSILPTREAARYEAALNELQEHGWVRPAAKRAGDSAGRRSKDWAINPKLREASP